jgi:hypothetical protein
MITSGSAPVPMIEMSKLGAVLVKALIRHTVLFWHGG